MHPCTDTLTLLASAPLPPLAPLFCRYVTEATIASIRGFRHQEWAVRNSSTMLFSALLQRAITNHKNVDVSSDTFAETSSPGEVRRLLHTASSADSTVFTPHTHFHRCLACLVAKTEVSRRQTSSTDFPISLRSYWQS